MSLPLARRITHSFPALRHRDFTLLWIGQLLSFAGSRMQTAAILWHVSLLAAPERKGIAPHDASPAPLMEILDQHDVTVDLFPPVEQNPPTVGRQIEVLRAGDPV